VLNTNKTGHHIITDMLLKLKWCKIPIKMVTKLYIITDILLKVAINTYETCHDIIRYNWDIVESGVKQ